MGITARLSTADQQRLETSFCAGTGPATFAARLADLEARSAATDRAAAAALQDLLATGTELATAMERLADAIEA